MGSPRSLRVCYLQQPWSQLRDRRPGLRAGHGLVTRRDPRPARRGSSTYAAGRTVWKSMRMVRLPTVGVRRRALLSSCHVSVGVPPRKECGGVALGVRSSQVPRARTSLAHPLQPSSAGARWEGRETADLDRCHQFVDTR